MPAPRPSRTWYAEGDHAWHYPFGQENRFELVLVYNHLHYPKRYVVSCYKLGLDTVLLPEDCASVEAAQAAAIAQVRAYAKDALESLTDR